MTKDVRKKSLVGYVWLSSHYKDWSIKFRWTKPHFSTGNPKLFMPMIFKDKPEKRLTWLASKKLRITIEETS